MSSPNVATIRARLDAIEVLIVQIATELKELREQIHASTPELGAHRLPSADRDGALGPPAPFLKPES